MKIFIYTFIFFQRNSTGSNSVHLIFRMEKKEYDGKVHWEGMGLCRAVGRSPQ